MVCNWMSNVLIWCFSVCILGVILLLSWKRIFGVYVFCGIVSWKCCIRKGWCRVWLMGLRSSDCWCFVVIISVWVRSCGLWWCRIIC